MNVSSKKEIPHTKLSILLTETSRTKREKWMKHWPRENFYGKDTTGSLFHLAYQVFMIKEYVVESDRI